jgi:CHAP domain
MNDIQKMVAVARSQIGVKELPRNSNDVKYTRWYGIRAPWCAMFVSWVARQAGISQRVLPTFIYTPAGATFFKLRGRWSRTPRVGAIAFYDRAGLGRISHTGVIVRVLQDGWFEAVEGNTDDAGGRTGGRVMLKTRRFAGKREGCGMPRYADRSAPPRAPAAAPQDHRPKPRRGTPVALVEDGVLGPKTVRAWRKDLKVSPSPRMTKTAVRAAQRRLNLHGGRLAVDGVLGPRTTRALRRSLDLRPEGGMNKSVIRAVQRHLNAANHR